MNFKNKAILVTGGTGTFGKEVVKLLLSKHNPKKVIVFSRDELKQFEMKNEDFFKKYEKRVRFFIGDIRDYERLKDAMFKVDYVIHAAALKQIETSEYNPSEFIKTNILGSANVIRAAIDNKVKKLIGLSTDKAVSPANLYGATKLCSEKLFVASNNYYGYERETKISIVRYGNVINSRGSVVPIFRNYKGKIFPITDIRMTRFNLKIEEAATFVLNSLNLMMGNEIFVPKLKSYKIVDLLEAIKPNANYKIVGIRSGEKLHEDLISIDESRYTIEFKKFYIIYNSYILQNKKYLIFIKSLRGKKVKNSFFYRSDKNNFLSVSQIKELINSLEDSKKNKF